VMPDSFVWTDAFKLGFAEMDSVHHDFVAVVNTMLSCTDAEFPGALDQFFVHAAEHFGAEDAWMKESGFPAMDCHIAEHAAVMKSAEEVRAEVLGGNVSVGRGFARELAKWFPGHADYLDSALSHWMFKLQHGGKPVVLRRDLRLGA
jgi:hemerythrin